MDTFSTCELSVDDARFGALRELVSSVFSLLDIARQVALADQALARASVDRAYLLLQEQNEIHMTSARRGARVRGLLDWQARRVCEHIDKNIGASILVSDLSALVQLSEAYFARAFKRTYGKTPHSYVIGCRLDQASYLLLNGCASISDIAVECGFTDQAHLCKLFRRRMGQSPAAWRREARARTGAVAGGRLQGITCHESPAISHCHFGHRCDRTAIDQRYQDAPIQLAQREVQRP
jgi:AraC family transcriptional regulator